MLLPWSPRRAVPAALALLVAGGVLAPAAAPKPADPAKPVRRTKPPKAAKPAKPDDAAPPASTPAPASTSAPAGTSVPASPPAAPELGRSVALATLTGTVQVRPPGGTPAPLTAAAASLPTGTHVDARHGSVALTSAVDAAGITQTGRFSGGIFVVRQHAGGVTELVLVGGRWSACRARTATRARATAVARRRPIRHLWGSDHHGRFQTRGGGSVATVRGTRWLTEDFCDGTRTTVTSGAVAVRSRRTGRTVLVRAGGHRFVAR